MINKNNNYNGKKINTKKILKNTAIVIGMVMITSISTMGCKAVTPTPSIVEENTILPNGYDNNKLGNNYENLFIFKTQNSTESNIFVGCLAKTNYEGVYSVVEVFNVEALYYWILNENYGSYGSFAPMNTNVLNEKIVSVVPVKDMGLTKNNTIGDIRRLIESDPALVDSYLSVKSGDEIPANLILRYKSVSK